VAKDLVSERVELAVTRRVNVLQLQLRVFRKALLESS
jgi:hypothetical protein